MTPTPAHVAVPSKLRLLLPLAAGLLAAAAFPPSPLWLLGLFALVPLYHGLATGGGFGMGFLAGMIYHGLTIYWIGFNSEPPPLVAAVSAVGAMAWLSLWWGLGTTLVSRLLRRFGAWALLLHGPLMVSFDWLIERGEMGFPWTYLGVTQARNPLFASLPAFGGMHGMTLAVLLFSGLVWLALFHPRSRRLSLAGLLLWLLLVPGLGRVGMSGAVDSGDSLDVLVIQGNIEPEEKWSRPYTFTVDRHLELSRQALQEAGPVDLLVWSETAVPTRLSYRPALLRELGDFCADSELALLTGANDMDRRQPGEVRRPYNGSFLITADGIVDSYRKIRLVPFGERVPGQNWIPALGRINLGQAEFGPGTDRSAGRLPLARGDSLSFGWSICFEGNFPSLARAMVRDGASLLTNQTNDAWFGTSLELDQHLAVASLRSVETGRWLVRSTNNGYSGFVDERGRHRGLLAKGESGWSIARVPLRMGETFYVWSGDLLPRLSLLLVSWPLLLLLVETLGRLKWWPGRRTHVA